MPFASKPIKVAHLCVSAECLTKYPLPKCRDTSFASPAKISKRGRARSLDPPSVTDRCSSHSTSSARACWIAKGGEHRMESLTPNCFVFEIVTTSDRSMWEGPSNNLRGMVILSFKLRVSVGGKQKVNFQESSPPFSK